MEKKGRRDQIQTTWTEEAGNEMYSNTEKGELSEEAESYNELYDTVKHGDDEAVVAWNEEANR